VEPCRGELACLDLAVQPGQLGVDRPQPLRALFRLGGIRQGERSRAGGALPLGSGPPA
jgi:hypothetical protein